MHVRTASGHLSDKVLTSSSTTNESIVVVSTILVSDAGVSATLTESSSQCVLTDSTDVGGHHNCLAVVSNNQQCDVLLCRQGRCPSPHHGCGVQQTLAPSDKTMTQSMSTSSRMNSAIRRSNRSGRSHAANDTERCLGVSSDDTKDAVDAKSHSPSLGASRTLGIEALASRQ